MTTPPSTQLGPERTAHLRKNQGTSGGGTSAVDELMRLYIEMRPELERFLTARLAESALAQDVYQAIFLRLQRAQLPDVINNPRAFLYKMANNLANDQRRGQQRGSARDRQWLDTVTERVGPDAIVDQADIDDSIDAKRRLDMIVNSLTELSPKCREAFVLHKLQGLSHIETAEKLGVTRKTIEKHMTIALKHLFGKLRASGVEK